jgi:hypothetical protein
LVGLTALVLLSVRPFVGYWQGVGVDELRNRYLKVWPYGPSALESWLRAQMALYLALVILVVAYGIALLAASSDAEDRPPLKALSALGFVAFAFMAAVAASIVLFNFPKGLALPSLRNQEGLLISWWRARYRHSRADPTKKRR